MERIPVELLYVLGFIAFVLFNFFVQRAARRRQQEQAPVEEAPEPSPPQDDLSEDVWGRTAVRAAPVAEPPARPLVPPAPVPRRVHPVRALLQDSRGLRRAVVLAMVLGPCRAQQPPEQEPPRAR